LSQENIFGYDMTGKQQQNNAYDNKPKNNMFYFFHLHNQPVLSSNNGLFLTKLENNLFKS